MPCDSKAVVVDGSFNALLTALFMRSTISGGVPLAAMTPYHISTFTPVRPDPSSVGTFGNCARRFGPPTAKAFSLPAWIWALATCIDRKSVGEGKSVAVGGG